MASAEECQADPCRTFPNSLVVKKRRAADDVINQLKDLQGLKEGGMLSNCEFKVLKQRVMRDA